MIDTHTHLFVKEFDEDRAAVVERALKEGVTHFLLPNIDVDSINALNKMSEDFAGICFPMMGLHPCSVNENWQNDLVVIKKSLDSKYYCAVGEIGIDLYWDKTTLPFQIEAFKTQINWAKEKNLPIVIHVRDAFEETLNVIDEMNDESLTGVFHCFTGTLEQANHIINYGGFKLGIGGVITYKNSSLPEVIKNIDLSHLVLETDSPYLPPMPHRGKRNESSFIKYVADKIAEIKSITFEEVDLITTQNTKTLFSTVK